MGATAELQTEPQLEAVAAIRTGLAKEFRADAQPTALPAVEFAFDPVRNQYASIPVMEQLAGECPPDAWKLLAVTARDLFIPVLTFVYGQAQLGGRVGIVSLARLEQQFYKLPPDRDVFLARALKEALHETGHMAGLLHCVDRSCAMTLSTNIRQIDAKQAEFCRSCQALLRRHLGD